MTNRNTPIILRPSIAADLPLFYQFQQDETAGRMAAFLPRDRFDREAWLARHETYLTDPAINNQTILLEGSIVGSIAKFVLEGQTELSYWLDKKYWGQGIGTRALQRFLEIETARPIYGRVAFDNLASCRILEKAGFQKIGSESDFAEARGTVVTSFVYVLH